MEPLSSAFSIDHETQTGFFESVANYLGGEGSAVANTVRSEAAHHEKAESR
jgi:hypothetical protein